MLCILKLKYLATSIASSVFPLAVGPINTITNGFVVNISNFMEEIFGSYY